MNEIKAASLPATAQSRQQPIKNAPCFSREKQGALADKHLNGEKD
ncbi:hypothetical protein [Thalassomonas actiniarum]|nr:hypothetical protein [Thalassomonas actiniarum]